MQFWPALFGSGWVKGRGKGRVKIGNVFVLLSCRSATQMALLVAPWSSAPAAPSQAAGAGAAGGGGAGGGAVGGVVAYLVSHTGLKGAEGLVRSLNLELEGADGEDKG